MQKKEHEYAAKIIAHMADIFRDECEHQIKKEELLSSYNATAFFHALANIMPAHIHNTLTDNEYNLLEVNHIANNLVFQFAGKETLEQ